MLLDEPVEFGRVIVQKKRTELEQSVEALLHCEKHHHDYSGVGGACAAS